jgi:spore coat polysaccharide biosynthesis protein SpsF
MGSSRLPGKVMKEILGEPLIKYQLDRIKKSKYLDELVVAIPTGTEDEELSDYLSSEGITTFRGDLNDVLSRFERVISNSTAEVIIRSTADCPLFMSEILDEMLEEFETTNLDYLSNAIVPTYPDGLDIEIFTRDAFLSLVNSELTQLQREHVTMGFYDGTHDYKIKNFENSKNLSSERWTVDYQEDFEFISEVFIKNHKHINFTEVLDFLWENPGIRNAKPGTFRNISLEKGLHNEQS